MSRGEALAQAARRLTDTGIDRADARAEAALLLRYATNLSREELFLRPDAVLSEVDAERFQAAIARRAAREPLAYITGTRDFYGLTFSVTPDVLIPRPETEGVVEAVLDRIGGGNARVLDLCTGSGCIAVAVAVQAPDARITATDISPEALTVARANAVRHEVADRVTFSPGDLFAAVPEGRRFAVIASNPPYIAPEEIALLEPEVRDFEPRIALGILPDPLHFYRRIASESPSYLMQGGSVIVEVGQGQSIAVSTLLQEAGFTDVSAVADLAGIPRVVIATGYSKP